MRQHRLVRMTIALLFAGVVIIIWKIRANIRPPPCEAVGRNDENGENIYSYNSEYPPPLRVVHFDLKGSPPKLSYLKELLPLIVAAGGNALLLEYEDTFPYEDLIQNISASHAYSKIEILELLSLCDYYGLEVIPLVQTFGHLEYVLKLEQFMHLREDHSSPQEICPSNPMATEVVKEMISQVLLLHKTSKWIHIGCDEVSNLNVCSNCLKRKVSSKDIFIDHVKTVSDMITTKYPHIRPLIWDDMLRTWPASYIGSSELNKYVEPVIWIYGSNIEAIIPRSYWYWYFEHFPNIWIAGAFKGATDEMALVPDARRHLENQKSWLQFLSKYAPKRTRITGYVLTGWSRYDHFAALCELLPVSLPSLILNLLKISSIFTERRQENFRLAPAYNGVLKCTIDLQLNDIIQLKDTRRCTFPGQELIPAVLKLIDFRKTLDNLYAKLYERNPWMTAFHLERIKNTNFPKLLKFFGENEFRIACYEFKSLCKQLRSTLKKYFNEHTVDEWFLEHVHAYSSKLEFLHENFETLRTYEMRTQSRGRQWYLKNLTNTSK